MKYIVKISVWYDNNAEFAFNDIETAAAFLDTAAEHLVITEKEGQHPTKIDLTAERILDTTAEVAK